MIYLITNKITGDRYVGKTSRTIEGRWYQHQKNAEYGHETYLYRAMRKYGFDNFIVEQLSDGLDEEEIVLIDQLRPEYNMTRGGDGGDMSASPKWQESVKRRNCKGENNPMYGKRGTNNPNYGKKRTTEQKAKIASSEYLAKKRIPVRVYGIDYDSVKAAADALGRSEKYVRIHDERNEWTY